MVLSCQCYHVVTLSRTRLSPNYRGRNGNWTVYEGENFRWFYFLMATIWKTNKFYLTIPNYRGVFYLIYIHLLVRFNFSDIISCHITRYDYWRIFARFHLELTNLDQLNWFGAYFSYARSRIWIIWMNKIRSQWSFVHNGTIFFLRVYTVHWYPEAYLTTN